MTEIDEFLAEWITAERTGEPAVLGRLLTDHFLVWDRWASC